MIRTLINIVPIKSLREMTVMFAISNRKLSSTGRRKSINIIDQTLAVSILNRGSLQFPPVSSHVQIATQGNYSKLI